MAERMQGARRAHWQQIIERQQASGLSIQRFCQQESLATATFFEWKRRFRQASPAAEASTAAAVKFAPVRIVPDVPAAMAAGTIEIVLGGPRRIRLVGPVDRTTLADVLAVLEG